MKAPIDPDTLPAWRDYRDYKTSSKPQFQKKLVSIAKKYHGSPFMARGRSPPGAKASAWQDIGVYFCSIAPAGFFPDPPISGRTAMFIVI
jgi:hypothetical protein